MKKVVVVLLLMLLAVLVITQFRLMENLMPSAICISIHSLGCASEHPNPIPVLLKNCTACQISVNQICNLTCIFQAAAAAANSPNESTTTTTVVIVRRKNLDDRIALLMPAWIIVATAASQWRHCVLLSIGIHFHFASVGASLIISILLGIIIDWSSHTFSLFCCCCWFRHIIDGLCVVPLQKVHSKAYFFLPLSF